MGAAVAGALGPIDLRGLATVLLRRWLVVACGVLGVVGLAVAWLLQVAPVYTATAQLLIDSRQQRLLNKTDSQYEIALALESSSIATEVTLIRSFSIARRVAERLRLDTATPAGTAQPAQRAGPLAVLKSVVRGSEPGAPHQDTPGTADVPAGDPGALSPQMLAAIGMVQGGTVVRRLAATYFIEIAFSHRDPAMAAKLANAVAEAYLDEQLEARYQAAKRAAGWLSERLAALRLQLHASERALADHRAKYNLVSPKGGTISDQQAAEVNAQLVSARAQTVEKKAKFDQAQKILSGGVGLETVAAVMDSPVIAALRQQEAALARSEADQLTRYGPEHPAIVKVRAERADIRRQMGREMSRLVQTLKTDYEFSLRKEQSLQSSLDELTLAGNRDDGAVIRLRELEREAQSNRVLFDNLLSRFKEVEQQTTVSGPESRIVAPAFKPTGPSYPNKRGTLMMALIAGLAFGVGAAFLLEYVESGFATIEQVEHVLKVPVLAIVPQLSKREREFEGKVLPIPELVARRPLSQFGESIRSIRVGTQMSNIDEPPRLILVTSAVPSEGKTTIALSMAYSAAAAGQRVLVLDCDLRHPSSSRHFNLHEAPGLTDLLLGEAPPEKVFAATSLPRLTIIPAGTTTRHPPDILGSERMRLLLDTLRTSYDAVYIDAPPTSPVIDAALLSTLVDKVVLVVQWRKTPRDVVRRSMQAIEQPRHRVAGIVLNNTQLGRMASYGTYYSYYGKQYQKYYAS